jgi:hypothetical protein
LFINILSAASCGQPLQVSAVPRGARMVRVAVAMNQRVDQLTGNAASAFGRTDVLIERVDLKKRRARCQFENKIFFT